MLRMMKNSIRKHINFSQNIRFLIFFNPGMFSVRQEGFSTKLFDIIAEVQLG